MKSVPDAFKERKNASLVKPIFLYEIQYDKVSNSWLRFANWTENVTFDGTLYTKAVITHSGISEGLDGSASRVNLQVGNIDRLIQYYLENFNGLRDAQVNILMVFADELANPTVVDRQTFYIADSAVDAGTADFTLSSKFEVFDITLPRRKFYRGYCTFKFKDEGCAYSGTEGSCDKTLQRCTQLGNVHRFGAFPAIPQKNVYNVNVSAK